MIIDYCLNMGSDILNHVKLVSDYWCINKMCPGD